MKNILIVEDDIHIGNALEETLISEGYSVSRAYSGTEAVLVLAGAGADCALAGVGADLVPAGTGPDLVLLDLMLPGLSGEEVLSRIRELRSSREIPIIVMSARGDVDSKVELLLGGAVDYVTKPFQMKELLARIAVHLRTYHVESQAEGLRFGEIVIHTDIRKAAAGGTDLRLTRTEYAILKLLVENRTRVLTKSVLLDRISLDTPDCTEGSLKMHISNLRRKLKDAGCREYIEAVWGIGFQLKDGQNV